MSTGTIETKQMGAADIYTGGEEQAPDADDNETAGDDGDPTAIHSELDAPDDTFDSHEASPGSLTDFMDNLKIPPETSPGTEPQILRLAEIPASTEDERLERAVEALPGEDWREAYEEMRAEGKTEHLKKSPENNENGLDAYLWIAILDSDTPEARLVWRLKFIDTQGDSFTAVYQKQGNDYHYAREDIEGNESWVSLRENLTGEDLEAYEAAMAKGESSYRVRIPSEDTDSELCYLETDLESGITLKVMEQHSEEEEDETADGHDGADTGLDDYGWGGDSYYNENDQALAEAILQPSITEIALDKIEPSAPSAQEAATTQSSQTNDAPTIDAPANSEPSIPWRAKLEEPLDPNAAEPTALTASLPAEPAGPTAFMPAEPTPNAVFVPSYAAEPQVYPEVTNPTPEVTDPTPEVASSSPWTTPEASAKPTPELPEAQSPVPQITPEAGPLPQVTAKYEAKNAEVKISAQVIAAKMEGYQRKLMTPLGEPKPDGGPGLSHEIAHETPAESSHNELHRGETAQLHAGQIQTEVVVPQAEVVIPQAEAIIPQAEVVIPQTEATPQADQSQSEPQTELSQPGTHETVAPHTEKSAPARTESVLETVFVPLKAEEAPATQEQTAIEATPIEPAHEAQASQRPLETPIAEPAPAEQQQQPAKNISTETTTESPAAEKAVDVASETAAPIRERTAPQITEESIGIQAEAPEEHAQVKAPDVAIKHTQLATSPALQAVPIAESTHEPRAEQPASVPHAAESQAPAIKQYAHTVEPHPHATAPTAYTAEPRPHVTEPTTRTTEPITRAIEPAARTIEPARTQLETQTIAAEEPIIPQATRATAQHQHTTPPAAAIATSADGIKITPLAGQNETRRRPKTARNTQHMTVGALHEPVIRPHYEKPVPLTQKSAMATGPGITETSSPTIQEPVPSTEPSTAQSAEPIAETTTKTPAQTKAQAKAPTVSTPAPELTSWLKDFGGTFETPVAPAQTTTPSHPAPTEAFTRAPATSAAAQIADNAPATTDSPANLDHLDLNITFTINERQPDDRRHTARRNRTTRSTAV